MRTAGIGVQYYLALVHVCLGKVGCNQHCPSEEATTVMSGDRRVQLVSTHGHGRGQHGPYHGIVGYTLCLCMLDVLQVWYT